MKKFRFNTPQRGFTLIELMIAMLIGVFLMAGVIQIFLSAKQAYRLQENLSRLQENGRFAMDIMTKDIRMAGYSPYECLPKPTPLPPAFDKVNNTNNLCGTATLENANNWCASTNRACVASATYNTTNNTRTDVIRSCQWLTVPSPCTTTASEISYFIRVDDSNSNIPALWRYDSVSASAQERVEGIERMQILYGVDTDPPDYVPNYYADAGVVAADWSKVVSVRVTLLLVSMDNNLTDTPQPFLFGGVNYGTATIPQVCSNNGVIVTTAPLGSSTAPTCTSPNKLVNDLRIRRVFSSTIAVRNRLP
jgi:type IV pilus assembly protein PilW